MNTPREKFWSIVAAFSVVAAVSCFLLWQKDKAILQAALQSSGESRDRTVVEPQAKFNQPQGIDRTMETVSKFPGADVVAELNRRIDKLAAEQANTLAFVQKLSSMISPDESQKLAQQRQEELSANLEKALRSHEQTLGEAHSKMEQLALNLNIPLEVDNMDPETGLDSVALKQYWPFFEAKQKVKSLRHYENIIKMKAIAARLDAEIPPSR